MRVDLGLFLEDHEQAGVPRWVPDKLGASQKHQGKEDSETVGWTSKADVTNSVILTNI